MAPWSTLLDPRTWFQPKEPRKGHALHKARRPQTREVVIGSKTKSKRKAEDELTAHNDKRLRLEEVDDVSETSPNLGHRSNDEDHSARYWRDEDIDTWATMNGHQIPHFQALATNGDSTVDVDSSMRPPPKPAYPSPVSRTKSRRSTAARDADESNMEYRDNVSVVPSSNSRLRHTQEIDFDAELARRHAAAVQLPHNSGIWALSEKQLFYHLALRGFEPLLAQSWMLDFKTLPLSLFANKDTDSPLIKVDQGKDFHAVRALRELIETGKIVRDKSLTGAIFSPERTIEKSVRAYFTWAFADSDFDTTHSTYTPIHAIATRKRGQPTTIAISILAQRLQMLSTRHRENQGVLSSIESTLNHNLDMSDPPLDTSPTQVYDDSSPNEPPTLVGILIVSAIVVIFTLNSHNSLRSGARTDNNLDSSGVRFIAKFDFADPKYDVWNAIAVAITAVHVRETMQRNAFPKIVRIKEEEGSIVGVVNDAVGSKSSMMGKWKGAGIGKGKAKGKSKEKEKEKAKPRMSWFAPRAATVIDEDDPDL
jgi:hypothetical protein